MNELAHRAFDLFWKMVTSNEYQGFAITRSRSQSPRYPCGFHVPQDKGNVGSGNEIGDNWV